MVECDICGDEFDTERGMKIHRTEMHSPDEDSDESSGSETSGDGSTGNGNRVNLSPKLSHLMVAVLFVGFVAGGFSGYVASDVLNAATPTGQEGALTVDDGDNNPSPSGDQGTQDTDTGDTGSQDGLTPSEVTLEGEPVLGQEDAPVTMLVYEDFACPFCKQFEENAMPQIVENYVDSGQVKVVWKDRPLPNLHPWAEDAAATMECVYREGGNDPFWAVKDKIFANQDSISTSNVQSKIKQWAADEGVSQSAVQSCLDNGNPMEEVNTDSTNGQKLGASGTPTAYVNGEELVGAQPYSRFESIIEDALSE
jgi:protein-disulfide isomerase